MENIFNNTEIAFSLKSDSELERAYFLFRMIKSEPLVRIGTAATNFAIKAHLPVEGLIRSTVFDHFCGGVTEEDCMSTIENMFTKNVHAVLDYSVEGAEVESQFDLAMNKTLANIDFAKEKLSIPFAVFKPSGFGRLALYQKVSECIELSDREITEWQTVKERYNTVSQHAFDNGVKLLIDAEESWMQNSADDLIEEMMQKYNKQKVIVFGTLQLYRWDRLDYLKELHKRAKEQGFYIGMKLVRGAYMEKERERAEEKGYKSPICNTKEDTDLNYDNVVRYMLKHIDEMEIFEGTHNEESTFLLMQLIEEYKLHKNDSRIWFGQLYGMSDHISYNLSKSGYNVAKYLPYGPVKDVMPYLIRRAEENTSVAGQTSRELELLKRERKRRKL
ncbi:MAG: proline dehydrogenase family protein [Flavobacteriaceae bacterium]|nr:proline dehydrogenase family protein [Flavobacteriaceae bacterium]